MKKDIVRGGIRSILGDNFDRVNSISKTIFLDEPEEESDTWVYCSSREVPYGSRLVIHFSNTDKNAKVLSWEWASE